MRFRKKINLDEKVLAALNTTCPLCQAIIEPSQIRRVNFEDIQCPFCDSIFKPMQIEHCPYCVEGNEFKTMLWSDDHFICTRCGHMVAPNLPAFLCPCPKCQEAHRGR